MAEGTFGGLKGGDVLLVRESATKDLVSVALCMSSSTGDVLLSTINGQGRLVFVPMNRYVQSLPSARFVECVWMEEWDDAVRGDAMRAALSLQQQCGCTYALECWLVERGGVHPNDAFDLWWWAWRNAKFFREMCIVAWAIVAATRREWEWGVLCPSRFSEWLRTTNAEETPKTTDTTSQGI